MITASAWTHVGLERTRNEDAIALPGLVLVGSPPGPVTVRLDVEEGDPPGLFAVIDGMGGHAGGQEASHLVAVGVATASHAADLIPDMNDRLYDEMILRPQLQGMGATIAAVEVAAHQVCFHSVGDARGYVQQDGFAVVATVDDRSSPASNVITQSLGGASTRTPVRVNLKELAVESSMRILLCSDGLSDYVRLTELQEALDSGTPRQSCSDLVDLALDAGAPDNVSVVVLDIDGK